jgi:hypothetical protein
MVEFLDALEVNKAALAVAVDEEIDLNESNLTEKFE